MRKIIFIILALLMAAPVMGQVPDNDAIRAKIYDASSSYYYPVLMSRYMKGDTTLTKQDYHYLYYGFAFQKEYKPHDPVPGENDVLMILEGNPQLTIGNAQDIIHFTGQVMQRDPFNMTNINFMTYAYGLLGEKENEIASAMRFNRVFETIDSSGTGEKETEAWHVIFFTHVNDFLLMKGYEPHNRRLVSRSVEYVTLKQSDRKNNGLYFDFSRVYWNPPTHMPEKPKGLKLKL